jgi:hypothetical protein
MMFIRNVPQNNEERDKTADETNQTVFLIIMTNFYTIALLHTNSNP